MATPQIIAFTADPATVAPGERVTLTAVARDPEQREFTGRLREVNSTVERNFSVLLADPVVYATDPQSTCEGVVLVTMETEKGAFLPLTPGAVPGIFTAAAPDSGAASLTARARVVGVPGSERVVTVRVETSGPEPVRNALLRPSAFGWPDETNTGVPAGTKLTGGGYLTIDQPGTVVEDMDLAGVTVRARNVTIRRCKIHRAPTPGFGCIRTQGDTAGLLVEDSEMWYEAPSDPSAVIGGSGYTLRRCNIHDVTEGPRLGNDTTVEFCYIHHPLRISGGHIDVLQTTGGSNITIRRNTLVPYHPDTGDVFNSAVFIKSDSTAIARVRIEENLLNGGNYTVYLVKANHPVSDVVVRGNRWGRNFRYGPFQIDGVTGLIWSEDNVWDDTGAPVR